LEEVYEGIHRQFLIMESIACGEEMQCSLTVFLPNGKRFFVKKVDYEEPSFLVFVGSEEGDTLPSVSLVPYEHAQLLFESRELAPGQTRETIVFVDLEPEDSGGDEP
jgi:hypothetical protein